MTSAIASNGGERRLLVPAANSAEACALVAHIGTPYLVDRVAPEFAVIDLDADIR